MCKREAIRDVIVSLETLERNGMSGGSMDRCMDYGGYTITIGGKEYKPIRWMGNKGYLCHEYSGDYEII